MAHGASKQPIIGYLTALVLAGTGFSSCLNAELEKQAAILKEQQVEIDRQRREIEALKSAQQIQEKKQNQCNRAFRDYFEPAQTTADGERAVSLYKDGLELCPNDDVAHYELGRLLAAQGRYDAAEREFESALKINPQFTEAKARLEALRRGR